MHAAASGERVVENLPKFAALIACAALLLALNAWFVRVAWNAIWPGPLPDTIAPVQMGGSDDKDKQAGTALAMSLLGRMGHIREGIAAAVVQLSTPLVEGPGIRAQDVRGTPVPVDLPKGLLAPLNVEMKVAGVEVGGLLNGLHRLLTTDNALLLTVQNEPGRAVVSGAWNNGKDTLWLEVAGAAADKPVANDRIATRVAHALVQRQLASRMPELGAFSAEEFEALLDVFTKAAALNQQATWGGVAEAEFAELFAKAEKLVTRAPHWKELVHFAARLADRSAKTEAALGLYKQSLALQGDKSTLRKDIEVRIAALSDRLLAKVPVSGPPEAMAGVALAKPGPAASPATVATWPLAALGVANLDMARPVRVGVLGGLPTPGTLAADRFTVVGDAKASPSDKFMADYVRTVVQAVSLVAPKAHFVFVPSASKGGMYSESQIVPELLALVEAKPDIVLITFGPLRGDIYARVFEPVLAAGITIVLPAGNTAGQPAPFDGTELATRLLVVASVGPDGKASAFTQRSNSVVWAPGENIPLPAAGGGIEPRSGTTYSAALAAGVVARLLASGAASRTPAQIAAVLTQTAQPLAAGGPKVLNLSAATDKTPR
jgi:hypothetical protein